MKKWISRLVAGACLLTVFAAHADDIRAFGPGSMESIVESRQGKPFVLLVWSLDCTYCFASMKALAQEKREHRDLDIVTLSTDSAADSAAVALMKKRLESLGMTADAWAYGESSPERLRYAIDPGWYGEKPRSYWFNAAGERVAYSGVIDAAVIEKLVQK